MSAASPLDLSLYDTGIVRRVQKVEINRFPSAYNPSICRFQNSYLMTFRVIPNSRLLYHSLIGLLLLDEKFQPISEPVILDTRAHNFWTISQSEDARLIEHQGRVFLVYNDNEDKITVSQKQRRDMFLAELIFEEGEFRLLPPKKLLHHDHVETRMWEKNWTPFFWRGLLLMIYSIDPHEIIYPCLSEGVARTVYLSNAINPWPWGMMRGGTPAEIVDGEFLTFFHSSTDVRSQASGKKSLWHYFMGAYTFSPDPPFRITRQSPIPISHPDFYTHTDARKRVVYPGGFVVNGDEIVLAYGKDDREVWLAFIDKQALLDSLESVEE